MSGIDPSALQVQRAKNVILDAILPVMLRMFTLGVLIGMGAMALLWWALG